MTETSEKRPLRRALRKIAPELARALGGPLAGAAADYVSRALLGHGDGSEEDLIAALDSADPEKLVTLRLAGLDFQRAVLEAATEDERIAASDRASARARQTAIKDRVPGALAFAVVAGFFAVLAVMLLRDIPEGAATEFSIMLGALATMAAAVMNYYFGSSAASREKTWMLRGLPEGRRER